MALESEVYDMEALMHRLCQISLREINQIIKSNAYYTREVRRNMDRRVGNMNQAYNRGAF